MKSVYLNHSQQSEQAHRLGWLILVLGLLSLGVTLIVFQQMKASNADLETQLAAHLAKGQVSVPRNTSPERNLDEVAVDSAISTIVTPWTSLLKALEVAAIDDNVKMLTFEPNAKTRSLRLKLVAKDKASMWAYLQRLNQQAVLKDTHLVSNRTITLSGQPALEFLVEATWPV